MCREFVNSHFRSSLKFFHFMDISDTSISKCFFSLSQIFVKSVLSSRFFIPITYVIHFQTIGMSLFLKFTNASVKSTIFRKINTDENRELIANNFVRKKYRKLLLFLMQKTVDPHQITVITDVRFMVLELSRSRSVVSNAHIQVFAQKLHVLDSLVRTAKKGAVGTYTRADTCACAGVPQPRLFEFTSPWHSGHCAEITLCQHFLRPSRGKRKICNYKNVPQGNFSLRVLIK